ncbi:hypothetical protein DDQ41_10310 [Streptomyces spongiicola]|uniref:Uncharacterized protein n=1 Tax=Streptomyces spongiicola TaxID=1690221 RepID=A0ABM6V5D2_9ACTN|nr:hypothetical protein DDQ41_10310 [Streptomyces spongiicola]
MRRVRRRRGPHRGRSAGPGAADRALPRRSHGLRSDELRSGRLGIRRAELAYGGSTKELPHGAYPGV